MIDPGVGWESHSNVEDRFSKETKPVSTVTTSWAEVFVVARVVGRFVVTLFRSEVSAGRKLITCFSDVNHFAKLFSGRRRGGNRPALPRANIFPRPASPPNARKEKKCSNNAACSATGTGFFIAAEKPRRSPTTIVQGSRPIAITFPVTKKTAAGEAISVKVRGFFCPSNREK